MQTTDWQTIDAPAEGESVRFPMRATIQLASGPVEIKEEGLVVRFRGKLYGWRNHCPHAGSPLDWLPGKFFSEDGRHLVCHTHYALFDPVSGDCIKGPCPRGLYPLAIREHGESIEVPTAWDPAG